MNPYITLFAAICGVLVLVWLACVVGTRLSLTQPRPLVSEDAEADVHIITPDVIPPEGIAWRMPPRDAILAAERRGEQFVIDLSSGVEDPALRAVYGKDPDVYLLMSKEERARQKREARSE